MQSRIEGHAQQNRGIARSRTKPLQDRRKRQSRGHVTGPGTVPRFMPVPSNWFRFVRFVRFVVRNFRQFTS
jgi:ribosomal protein L19E